MSAHFANTPRDTLRAAMVARAAAKRKAAQSNDTKFWMKRIEQLDDTILKLREQIEEEKG